MAYNTAFGFKSYIQFCKQASWTAAFVDLSLTASRGQKLELISWNVNQQSNIIDDNSLYSGISRRGSFQGGQVWKGTFVTRLNYEGLEELFRAIGNQYDSFSSVGSGLGSGNGVNAAVLDHVFTEATALGSLYIEVGLGGVDDTTKVFRITNAKVVGVTIKGTAGTGTDALLTAEWTVLGKDMISLQTPGAATTLKLSTLSTPCTAATTAGTSVLTLSGSGDLTSQLAIGQVINGDPTTTAFTAITPGAVVAARTSATSIRMSLASLASVSAKDFFFSLPDTPSVSPVMFHHMGATTGRFNDGTTADISAGPRLRGFEFSIECPMSEDRYYFSSLNIDEPLRSDFQKVMFKLTQEFNTVAQYNAARSFTTGTVQMEFIDPLGPIYSGGGTIDDARQIQFKAPTCKLTDFSAPVNSYGIILSTATWSAYQTTGVFSSGATQRNGGYFVRIRNARAALA